MPVWISLGIMTNANAYVSVLWMITGSTGKLSFCDLLFLEKNTLMITVETNILNNKKMFCSCLCRTYFTINIDAYVSVFSRTGKLAKVTWWPFCTNYRRRKRHQFTTSQMIIFRLTSYIFFLVLQNTV